jgi:hypothetical protein
MNLVIDLKWQLQAFADLQSHAWKVLQECFVVADNSAYYQLNNLLGMYQLHVDNSPKI